MLAAQQPLGLPTSAMDANAILLHNKDEQINHLATELHAQSQKVAQYEQLLPGFQALADQSVEQVQQLQAQLATCVSRVDHDNALAQIERRVREEERDRFDGERAALAAIQEQERSQMQAYVQQLAEQVDTQDQIIQMLQNGATAAPAAASPAAAPPADAPAAQEDTQELEYSKNKLRVAEERIAALEEEAESRQTEREELKKELLQAESKAKLLRKMHDAFKAKSLEEAKRNQASIASLEKQVQTAVAAAIPVVEAPEPEAAGYNSVEATLLRKQVAALEAKMSLKEKMAASQNERATEEKKGLMADVQRLQKERDELLAEVESKASRVTELEAKVEEGEANAAAAQASAASSAAEMESRAASEAREALLAAKVEQLEKQLLSAVSSDTEVVKQLRDQVSEAQEKLVKQAQEAATQSSLLEEKEKQIADLTAAAAAKEEADGKKEELLQASGGQLEVLKETISQQAASFTAMKEQLAAQVAAEAKRADELQQQLRQASDDLELARNASSMQESSTKESSKIIEEIYAKHRQERQVYEREAAEAKQQYERLKVVHEQTKARADELKATTTEFSHLANVATKKLEDEQSATFALRQTLAEREGELAQKTRELASSVEKVLEVEQQVAEEQLAAKELREKLEASVRGQSQESAELQAAKAEVERLRSEVEETAEELLAAQAELTAVQVDAEEAGSTSSKQLAALATQVAALQAGLDEAEERAAEELRETEEAMTQQLAEMEAAKETVEEEAKEAKAKAEELEEENRRLRGEMVAQIEGSRKTKEELQAAVERTEKQVVELLREQKESLGGYHERYEQIEEHLDALVRQLEVAQHTALRLDAAQKNYVQLEQMFTDERRQHAEAEKQVELERKRVEISKEITCDLQRHIIEITNAHGRTKEEVEELREEVERLRGEKARDKKMFEDEKTSILYDFLHRQYAPGAASVSGSVSGAAAPPSALASPRSVSSSVASHPRSQLAAAPAATGVEFFAQQVGERAALAQVKRKLVDDLWNHSVELTASASRNSSFVAEARNKQRQ